MPSAQVPARAKALSAEAHKLPGNAASAEIRLGPPEAAAIDSAKRANAADTTKKLQIGIGRSVRDIASARASALQWSPVEGGYAARWRITSREAKALRVGLEVRRTSAALEVRFSGSARPDVVYGPVTEAELAVAAGTTYWSPVLEGDTASVELFVRADSLPRRVSLAVAQVSHLFASPAQRLDDKSLKIGDSQSCEVNFICRASTDPELAYTGNAVARMTYTNPNGGTSLCTGTLLNSASGQPVPYFYTASHCIATQSAADTLTTHWFYESTVCGTNALSPSYLQVPGGATLLHVNLSHDISFMRLNRDAPSGATLAAWNAAPLATRLPFTAVHHPAGDLKKVSLGSFGGYVANSPGETLGYTGSFIRSDWDGIATGVTEGGSSGSGIFTQTDGKYAFRGGLLGGGSSCTAPASSLYDYYSRFDVAYSAISQYLSAAAPANYTALWWNASESGWGVNVDQQGDILFATLFTYDANGNPMWLVMSNGARQGSGDVFSGALYRTTGTPFNQPFGSVSVAQVGTMTLSFSGTASGTVSYTVNGIPVTKAVTKQVFSPTGPAQCTAVATSRASATNYTDLWWSAPANSESGWGINVTHQGSLLFATLFTYDTNGQGLWLVMSGGQRQADGSFSGPLYRTKGNGAFNAQPWPGVSVQQVGDMTLRFTDGENGTLAYSVSGTSVTKAITRQVFSNTFPACTS